MGCPTFDTKKDKYRIVVKTGSYDTVEELEIYDENDVTILKIIEVLGGVKILIQKLQENGEFYDTTEVYVEVVDDIWFCDCYKLKQYIKSHTVPELINDIIDYVTKQILEFKYT